jgi:hypothetical protein
MEKGRSGIEKSISWIRHRKIQIQDLRKKNPDP